MKLFHARDFAAAKSAFEQAVHGPSREMSHAARVHIRMCEQRLEKMQPSLQTPEDLYHYAISLINRRQLPDAEATLRRAVEGAPNADYIHYALALVRGLQGHLDDAARFLQRAIQIDPKNRISARNDPDFLEFGRKPPVRDLVFQENKESE